MYQPVDEVVQCLLPGGEFVCLVVGGQAEAGPHRRTPGSGILQQLCHPGKTTTLQIVTARITVRTVGVILARKSRLVFILRIAELGR